MPAERTFDASPSAEAILRAHDMLRLRVRQLYEREAGRPWPQEEGDPLVAPAEGRSIAPVTEPVKRAFDALRAAGQRLDEALMALHAYAPDHAAEIAHIREIRTIARGSAWNVDGVDGPAPGITLPPAALGPRE
jgi:hypothetical protein